MYSTGIKPNTSTVGKGDERGRGRGRGRGARGRGRAAAGTSRTIMDCKFSNIKLAICLSGEIDELLAC